MSICIEDRMSRCERYLTKESEGESKSKKKKKSWKNLLLLLLRLLSALKVGEQASVIAFPTEKKIRVQQQDLATQSYQNLISF